MPHAIEALAELGINPTNADHHPFRGIRFLDAANASACAHAFFRSASGIGIQRTHLYQLLLDRALSLGVRFQWQTTVQTVEADSTVVHTSSGIFRPRYLIGADGMHSRIRTLAGLGRGSTGAARTGIRQHYAAAPHTDLIEVYWSKLGQAYVTPISSSRLCVAFVYRARPSTTDNLSLFPALRDRLKGAKPIGSTRGAITLTRSLRHVTRGNIALVGDASGSVDAITGDGLALCFQQSLALVEAIAAENLTQYQHTHRRIARAPRLMSRLLLIMDRHPALFAQALRAFSQRPSLFPELLSMHAGEQPMPLLGTGGLVSLLICLLSS